MANRQGPRSSDEASARQASGADEVDPIIDQWYLRQDSQQKFVVTDYDEKAGTVEIQTAEGDLDELDQEA